MNSTTARLGDTNTLQRWELVPAPCRCRRCGREWEGTVPQFFLDLAERQKREDPWWYRTCPDCQPAEDAAETAFTERTRPTAGKSSPTGEPVLKEPVEEDGPEPTADQEVPF